MLDTSAFGGLLAEHGFRFYSGVPCSFLKDLINYAINSGQYVMASNEGDAVAVCAGAYVGGKKSVFLCQNSGLTNAVSPLTSLNFPFRLPVLGVVSLRGEPGIQDEPQHELMGVITTDLLELMRVEWEFLSDDLEKAREQVKRANTAIEDNRSFFFVVKQGTLSKVALDASASAQKVSSGTSLPVQSPEKRPARIEALQAITELRDRNTIFVATTGFTGRELYELGDVENNFYMVGSMGCASSFCLGLALARPDKRVVCIDGDGAILMRLGALPAVGYYAPKNLLHVLLDNNAHDSTGGQETVSGIVNFAQVAASSGYAHAISCDGIEELSKELRIFQKDPKLTFLSLRIAGGAKKDLARPKIKPFEVKARLMELLSKDGI